MGRARRHRPLTGLVALHTPIDGACAIDWLCVCAPYATTTTTTTAITNSMAAACIRWVIFSSCFALSLSFLPSVTAWVSKPTSPHVLDLDTDAINQFNKRKGNTSIYKQASRVCSAVVNRSSFSFSPLPPALPPPCPS